MLIPEHIWPYDKQSVCSIPKNFNELISQFSKYNLKKRNYNSFTWLPEESSVELFFNSNFGTYKLLVSLKILLLNVVLSY